MRITLKSAIVVAEGVWNVRGTLAVDRDAPVGMTEVRLKFEIDSPAEQKKPEKLIDLTERYCVIFQALANPPDLTSQLKRMPSA
ncbi:MAG: OsmC family protein [Desulfobacteraceae bacterium]|jgi:uncharacterized OsmC-like protein|nr:OsmC family protein [Desulfobacteraceae bacterium]